jgi:parvulin-like peptidyl-prolyl isomerase
MSRLQVTGLAVLLIAVVAYVVIQTRSDAGTKPGTESPALAETAAGGPAARTADPSAPTAAVTAEALARELPPGVSPLPESAPVTVTFGVILVGYRGAEDAPDSAQPKPAALDRAKALLAEARTDFAAAASKGDPGSTADAGRLPRGVLEPAVEYALFTLQPGGVSAEPIDTPRGYWIVKRLQ